MCEPHHSIVQWEDPNDDDQGGGGASLVPNAPQGGGGGILGSLGAWGKKTLGKWFHVSRMGAGHYFAVSSIRKKVRGVYQTFQIPPFTSYEAKWWDRSVHLDGEFYGLEEESKEVALAAALDYASQVSIGSLHSLRQFLETSISKSDRPMSYCETFRLMLNERGKKDFESRFKGIIKPARKGHHFYGSNLGLNDPELRDRMVKCVLGFTRKRHLLVPEWADDKSLWVPGRLRDGGTTLAAT